MRVAQVALPFYLLSLSISGWAQQNAVTAPSPVRDPRAVGALQQAIAAMGGNIPSDSKAVGTVTVIAGSSTNQGTIQISTRGVSQTAVHIQTPETQITEVFSNGQASEVIGAKVTPLTGNRAATTQSRDFPLPFLAALLANPDESLQFLGIEPNGASSVAHILATNTFASQPGWQVLSEFTPTDVWIDTQTALPVRLAWTERDAGGASPRMSRETLLSNYRPFGSVLYPTTIEKYFNGTLWMEITVQTVTIDSGLSDSNFPVAAVQQ